MYRFESPWLLLLLALLPLIAFVAARRRSLLFSSGTLLQGLPTTFKQRLVNLPHYLYAAALALAIVALARPQWGDQKQEVRTDGVDIVLCIDVSTSMYGLDMDSAREKNRLDVVKEVVSDFVAKRSSDRIGLVVFAGEAYTQSPMVFDSAMLSSFVERIEIGMTPEDGTAIGLGLMNSLARLERSEAKSKLVVLLTDGENNGTEVKPLTAAEAAKSLGIKVYTVAVGQKGRVPYKRQFFGREVVEYFNSNPDFSEMQSIAEITGGRFFRADDDKTLEEVYSEIDQLEKSEIDATIYFQWRELFSYALVAALGCIVLAHLLAATWLRRLV